MWALGKKKLREQGLEKWGEKMQIILLNTDKFIVKLTVGLRDPLVLLGTKIKPSVQDWHHFVDSDVTSAHFA